jgi:hypothetical protein
VRFICADLFAWSPERRYDVVFFGFWLSHVPLERSTTAPPIASSRCRTRRQSWSGGSRGSAGGSP